MSLCQQGKEKNTMTADFDNVVPKEQPSPPDIIYLQWWDEAGLAEEAVAWCKDDVTGDGVKYIRCQKKGVKCRNCNCELPMHRLGCPEARGETTLYAKVEELIKERNKLKEELSLYRKCFCEAHQPLPEDSDGDCYCCELVHIHHKLEQLQTEN